MSASESTRAYRTQPSTTRVTAPPRRSFARKPWFIALLAIMVGASAWLNWPGNHLPTAPAALDAEQIRAAQDFQVVQLVTTDLRWRLAEVPAENWSCWRAWPDPARHVLALAWSVTDNGPGASQVFEGFAALLSRSAGNVPTLAELAAAYTAIGAAEAAAVVEEAAQVAQTAGHAPGEPVERPEAFTVLDRKLLAKAASDGAVRLLRAYIYAHADELAATPRAH